MADSHTSRNVESPLARSVVDLSTTGVNASKSLNTSAASGESNSVTLSSANNSVSTPITTNTTPKLENWKNNGSSETEGIAAVDSMGGMVSDIERSGSISPTKIDRKTSTKKPSFKPVSLNKKFLKDTPATATVPTLLGSPLQSKSLGTSLSQPTPRLAAASKLKLVRTGGSSQASRPSGAGPGSSSSLRTEAQPVWNKNQPVPPPPKKEFTDEELSKKYGIHLASRLGSDDATNKEAKWADIDDDDDDWVPTTIEWMNVTVNTEEPEPAKPEPEPVPAKEPVKEPLKEPIVMAIPEPPVKLPTPQVTSFSPSGPKTLITQKPSAKPALTAASATPRPSPWATIPTPNAIPPSPINPSLHRPLELVRKDDAPRESSAMREVSAEVYDRHWRDKSGQNRELFNSHTGKMEPVQDVRGLVRSPAAKPAVLQRPSGSSYIAGPAEPSAAFQTGRTSHRPDDYRRRRTSSNVSGGSGSIGRRLSFTRYGIDPPTPDDMGFAQNQPMYSNPFDENGPPARQYGSYGHHHLPSNQSHKEMSPTMADVLPTNRPDLPTGSVVAPVVAPAVTAPPLAPPNIQPEPLPPQSSLEPVEDLVAQQDRIMKESRELARKRRLEEEEKLESEKRERLKAKLEALDRQAKEKEEKEAAARRAEEERLATEKQAVEEKRLSEERASEEKQRELERVRELEWEREMEQDAKATVARPVGPTTGHGMADSHQQRQASSFTDRYVRQPNFVRSTSPYSTIHPSSSLSVSHQETHQPSPSSSTIYDRSTSPKHYTGMHNNTGNNNYNRSQTWKGGPAANLRGNSQWSSSSASPWGAIGDGSRAGGFNNRAGDGYRPGGYSNGLRTGNFNNRSGHGSFHNNRYQGNDRRSNRDSPPLPEGPSPIGANISNDDRAKAISQWNSLPGQIVADEATARENNRRARLAREAEEATTGVKQSTPVQQYHIVESFKKYEIEDSGSLTQRSFVGKTTKEVEDTSNPTAVPKGPASSKPSKFFPVDASNTSQNVVPKPAGRPSSPPPPMSADHPVHGDIATRVHLPYTAGCASSPSTNGYSRPTPSGIARFEAVQQKILGQMGHKDSISQTQYVSPRSKPSFDTSPDRQLRAPTVSLPAKTEIVMGDVSMFTIPDSEHFIKDFFKQDFGSTPNVKIPRVSHCYNAISKSSAVALAKNKATVKKGSRFIVQIQSSDVFEPNSESRFVRVHMPGGDNKDIPYPRTQEKAGRTKYIPKKKGNSGGRVHVNNPVYSYSRQNEKKVLES